MTEKTTCLVTSHSFSISGGGVCSPFSTVEASISDYCSLALQIRFIIFIKIIEMKNQAEDETNSSCFWNAALHYK